MSAKGHKQIYAPQKAMSALPPKADVCGALACVCYGPIADIELFNDLTGNLLNVSGYRQAQSLCGSQVDQQFEFCRLLHRDVAWVCALQDFVGKNGRAAAHLYMICRIGKQSSMFKCFS